MPEPQDKAVPPWRATWPRVLAASPWLALALFYLLAGLSSGNIPTDLVATFGFLSASMLLVRGRWLFVGVAISILVGLFFVFLAALFAGLSDKPAHVSDIALFLILLAAPWISLVGAVRTYRSERRLRPGWTCLNPIPSPVPTGQPDTFAYFSLGCPFQPRQIEVAVDGGWLRRDLDFQARADEGWIGIDPTVDAAPGHEVYVCFLPLSNLVAAA